MLILASELWSARGDEDFFSVARTIPLVASQGKSKSKGHDALRRTFDAKGGDTLVDGIEGVFWRMVSLGFRVTTNSKHRKKRMKFGDS